MLISLTSAAASSSGEELTKQLRSEEHTSELQSRQYLVCRLLLEKKKQRATHTTLSYSLMAAAPRRGLSSTLRMTNRAELMFHLVPHDAHADRCARDRTCGIAVLR